MKSYKTNYYILATLLALYGIAYSTPSYAIPETPPTSPEFPPPQTPDLCDNKAIAALEDSIKALQTQIDTAFFILSKDSADRAAKQASLTEATNVMQNLDVKESQAQLSLKQAQSAKAAASTIKLWTMEIADIQNQMTNQQKVIDNATAAYNAAVGVADTQSGICQGLDASIKTAQASLKKLQANCIK